MSQYFVTQAISAALYTIGYGGILVVVISMLRQMKINDKKNTDIGNQLSELQQLIRTSTQDALTKLTIMHETLRDVQSNLRTVESKIGDLTMRVNIAEIRLEERKPNQLMMATPPTRQTPVAQRRGRRQKTMSAQNTSST